MTGPAATSTSGGRQSRRQPHIFNNLQSAALRQLGSRHLGQGAPARSRATRPPRKPPQPISTSPSFRSRRCWPPPISICAPRIHCAISSIAPSQNTTKPSHHAESIQRRLCLRSRLLYDRGRGPRRGPGAEHRSAGDQCRRAAGAIRACNRHADRPAAGRTHDRPAPAHRHYSKNSGRGSLDAARTAARHRRGRTNHAGTKRADRRRGGSLLSRHQPVRRCWRWIGTNPLPFNVANEVWSLGATGTQMLFNGGLRGAQVDAARAGLLAERRQLSSNRAHRFSAGRGSACRHPSADTAARRAAEGGQGRTQSGRCLSQSVPGRHGRASPPSLRRKSRCWPTRRPN